MIQVLCRRTRNNPVLIGEPGVGKTALVEGLATKIVHGDVPVYLAEKRVLALDISLIVAGTKYRGQFEERLKTIMRELTETPNIIIFIDELHTLVGAGSAEGSLDAANILKPALSRGEIQCIGATTPAEYRKHIEKDRALERRFQAVKVASPTELETVEILRGVKERYEKFHNVLYLDEAIEAAVYQSSRYITDRFLPDKAIDLIDEAGSRVKLREAGAPALVPELSGRVRVVLEADGEGRGGFFREEEQGAGQPVHVLSEQWTLGGEGRHSVGKGDIDEVVSRWTGIPITSLKEEESEKLLRMEEELHRRIVSQDGAISAVARAIRRTRAGLKNPNRPVGLVPVPGPDRRRQDRGGARPRGVPVRQRARARALRHVGVHGEALGLQADRLAARLRRPRRGRPAHRARQAQPVLRGAARRDREGAPRHLQRAAAGLRGRPPDRRHRQHGRLQEHAPDHDLQHRRALHREEGPHGLRRRRQRRGGRRPRTRW